jgi:hypothetical protein
MTRGMAMGDPLPSEAQHPIEDLDGGGCWRRWRRSGSAPGRGWMPVGRRGGLPRRPVSRRRPHRTGPVPHYERYKRPEDEWRSEIVAVVREPGKHEPAAMTAAAG